MIVITGDYNMNKLKEDLQEMYKKSGLKQLGVMFLLTEGQIVDEKFLVYINDLLSSGEINDLFPEEEVDSIVAACQNAAKAAL